MLIEALAKEKEQIRKEGRKEGEATACQMIAQIIQRRLGDMPDPVRQRLHQCTLVELKNLINPALDVATWAEFAAHLPEPKA
ncbi:MAG: DUF4351 domain-containing protein [Caldilineaceae bacterium]